MCSPPRTKPCKGSVLLLKVSPAPGFLHGVSIICSCVPTPLPLSRAPLVCFLHLHRSSPAFTSLNTECCLAQPVLGKRATSDWRSQPHRKIKLRSVSMLCRLPRASMSHSAPAEHTCMVASFCASVTRSYSSRAASSSCSNFSMRCPISASIFWNCSTSYLRQRSFPALQHTHHRATGRCLRHRDRHQDVEGHGLFVPMPQNRPQHGISFGAVGRHRTFAVELGGQKGSDHVPHSQTGLLSHKGARMAEALTVSRA